MINYLNRLFRGSRYSLSRQFSWTWVILGLSLVLFASISLTNHYNFRTYALDLGLYTNTSWKYAHGIIPDRSLFRWDNDLILADHFDLHLILWAPLTYLFGSWTLLIVQLVSLPIGALGVQRLIQSLGGNTWLSRMAMVQFLVFFGIYTSLSFDFHSSVVASMAVPWYLFALHREKRRLSWLILLFIIAAKENMGLWLSIIALASLFIAEFRKSNRVTLILQSAFSLAWSLIVLVYVMPSLDSTGSYHQFSQYPVLGSNISDAAKTLLTEPHHVVQALFVDTLQQYEKGSAIKMEFWIVFICSGAWALFRKWPFLIMATPIIFQKMLHHDLSKWGIFAHYSIEFAALNSIAVFLVILSVQHSRRRQLLAWLSVLISISATAYMFHLPIEHSSHDHGEHDRLRFFETRHYRSAFDSEAFQHAIERIPPEASISAVSPLLPHLIEREHLYQYPIVWDPDYILLIRNAFPWPLTVEEYAAKISEYEASPEWEVVFDRSSVLLFKRNRE